MSKEYERFKKSLPQRQYFYLRCVGLAFGKIHKDARRNWLRAICESDEPLRADILLQFLRTLAKEMASAEYHLKPKRGRRPKIEETAIIEAEASIYGLSLPKAVMNTGVERNKETSKKKANAIRQRQYRNRKKQRQST